MSAVRISQAQGTFGSAAPRVAATVDGAKVTWRVRPAKRGWPAYLGWLCSEHGREECDHRADIEEVLDDTILDRLDDWERRPIRA